jgi:Ion channel
MYYMMQTFVTVGYGDIKYTTATEHIISILLMFIGVIFFSLTIGAITNIFNTLDETNRLYEEKLNVLNHINREYQISFETFQ